MDLPWEPATLQQRNGRAVRQGNTQAVIGIKYIMSARKMCIRDRFVEWAMDESLNKWLPEQDYLTGLLWPRYDLSLIHI